MSVAVAFERARSEGRSALVGYLPAGFPSYDRAIAAIQAMVDGGVDVLEIGLPYSDPVMDGPTIQAAADASLRGGTRTTDVLRTVEAVARLGVPTLVMTYWNPIEQYGSENFAQDLANAGGSGLITPDLIPEEAAEWVSAADRHDLDKVFLVALSSTYDRLALTASACRGFVYAASVMGVTGARTTTSDAAPSLVERTRAVTTLPIGVGLGVSSGDQAAAVASYADAVIVGSAFVRRMLEAADPDTAVSSVHDLAKDLAGGVRRQ